jgi:glucokinase
MSHVPATIGIDIGGTKVAGTFRVGVRGGPVVVEPTIQEGAEALLGRVARMVASIAGSLESVDAVGLSVAGEIAYADGVVVSASNLPLAGLPLRAMLAERLGLPVFLDNDGNCAAIAEAHAAGSDPIEHVVVLTLGTGVGGGVISNGQVLRGRTGLGAELGHLVVSAEGPVCFGSCPNRGCLEALCSGTALARDARLLAEREPSSALAAILRQKGNVRSEDVVALARRGDRHARTLMGEIGTWLGVALSSIINIFEPGEIAIGGGLADAGDLFLSPAIREAATRSAPPYWKLVKIRLTRSGPHASAVGAALLAQHGVKAGLTGLELTGEPQVRNRTSRARQRLT